MAFDLKLLSSVLTELEEERGIAKDKVIEAIEYSLATAYKKEYGKRGQIIRAMFDINTGTADFNQVKIVVDKTTVIFPDEETGEPIETPTVSEDGDEEKLPLFNPEQHILIEDARLIKKDVQLGDELVFPLEMKDDFGRIAAQTAKQMIIQKIREAEKEHLSKEFGEREGDIVTGTVQRIERGNIFIDLGRATGLLPYDEQIPGERYRQGERIRAYLYRVEETPRGVFLRLSRSHPNFLLKLFAGESPEIAQGVVEVRAIAREAGSRSKVAVWTNDDHVDPVGALVGQRGVRVSTVMSELGGEKIDVVEWSENPEYFIEDALSPAKVLEVEILDEENHEAKVVVAEDQQSLAIGRGGQNVRLAAKLTGWRIDIQAVNTAGDVVVSDDETQNTDGTGETDQPNDAATSDIEDGGDEKTTTSDDVPADTDTDTPDELPDETETPEKQEDESKEE